MASVTKENLGNLHDKITVKVSKEDYYESFDKSLKKFAKSANIPGFRKGMVPVGMIKKQYGSSIFYDEVVKAVENELKDYLGKKNPEIFAQPLPMENDLRHLDMNQPADYEFPFEIGLKPTIDINLSNATPTLHKVKVSDQMVQDEVENLITKHGNLKDVEEVSAPENVLNVMMEESDADGNIIEGGIAKDNSILLKYFTEDFQQKLIGKKVNDSVVLQLDEAFPEKEREWILSDLGLAKEDEEAGKKYFKMTITKIGLVEKRELNEEFFNQVFPGKEIKTEEDFKKTLQEEIAKQWDGASKNQLHDQLYHTLIDMPMEFPEAFLKRWLEIGGEKSKSKEEVEAEYPTFINQLKWTLISDQIIREQGLDVSEAELRQSMTDDIMRYFGQADLGDGNFDWINSYIDRMMKDEKQVDSAYRKLITEKVFHWLENQVTPTEKEISAEEFTKMQHHHSH